MRFAQKALSLSRRADEEFPLVVAGIKRWGLSVGEGS